MSSRTGALGHPDDARVEVERFLTLESRLLDDRRFTEWLALFDVTATYWVPCNAFDVDPNRHVSLVYDDRARLSERIDRIQSGWAHAQDPPSRTSRIVGNLEIAATSDGYEVSSSFVLAEIRRHQQRIYAGRYRHRLVVRDEILIASKKVELVNNDDAIDNLTCLL